MLCSIYKSLFILLVAKLFSFLKIVPEVTLDMVQVLGEGAVEILAEVKLYILVIVYKSDSVVFHFALSSPYLLLENLKPH